MRLIPPLLTLAAAALAAAASAHELRLGASLTYAENFSRTSYAPTAQDATLADLDAAFLHAQQLAANWTLLAALEASAENVGRFSALNRLGLGARTTLRHKFGLGPRVPVLEAGAALTAVHFRERGRRGWREEGFASLSQRLTDSWRVAATASWESFTAAHAPFDTHARRIGLETFYDATETWQFGAGASRLHGQLVANAAWSVYGQALGGGFGPAIQDYYSRIPWEVSDTFGSGWVAYRVDCRADFWWAQVAARLSDSTSLPLRYESVRVVNRVGVRYDSAFWSLGVLHRF
ncbi:hypothetical protein [Oleiharenicola sp. Vm1]|uniref:hypothetical protein n=1 Tax=Oleiharenicola sp. Vm1 TaxID=3398393 RepID=UPI0039F60C98